MKQGKFELADGGTILLDEIRELSLDMQVKTPPRAGGKAVLPSGGNQGDQRRRPRDRGIEQGAGARGGRRAVPRGSVLPAECRIGANPAVAQPAGGRRGTCRGRSSREFCRRFNRPTSRRSRPKRSSTSKQLPWKGNVRELRNAMERVVLLNNVPSLTVEHFGFLRTSGVRAPSTSGNGKSFAWRSRRRGYG